MSERPAPLLSGDLVDLVRPRRSDFDDVVDILAGGAAASLATGGEAPPSADALAAASASGRESVLLVVAKSGETVGFVRWVTKKYPGSYEIGGLVSRPEQWDLGYGAEGTALALEHLFHACNAHRVQFVVGAFNVRTLRMVLHLGLPVEGILRDYFFLDGGYHDAVITSVLRDEFYALTRYGDVRDQVPRADKDQAEEMLLLARARQTASVGT